MTIIFSTLYNRGTNTYQHAKSQPKNCLLGYILTFITLWTNSDEKIDIFFFVFPSQQALKFHANGLQRRRPSPEEKTICMKCQSLFS